ncbi:hypothetical protein R1sor_002111 [Riccia sorocarpa]|uniref:Uncharacterized protein n=1 Tax=Riccia sorocarpa TaxID=122646 RepID=A0ABD3H0J4_9MARC
MTLTDVSADTAPKRFTKMKDLARKKNKQEPRNLQQKNPPGGNEARPSKRKRGQDPATDSTKKTRNTEANVRQYLASFKWLSLMTISKDMAEKLWAAAVNPSSTTMRDVDHVYFNIPEPERYWRSTRPTELTLLEAREREEVKFNDELNRIDKQMQELKKFYLERKGFSDSPARTAVKEPDEQKTKATTPAFDFVDSVTAYYMAPESVDALLGAGYLVAKEPPPKHQCEPSSAPEFIDLFGRHDSEEE